MTKSREEAVKAGVAVSETRHHMNRRSPWHDYRRAGTYMLTLVVAERRPLLGRLVHGMAVPCGEPQGTVAGGETRGTVAGGEAQGAVAARVELSALGRAISEEEIRKIPRFYPEVTVWKLCVMPDHIHMIVRVGRDMPEGKHLGRVVSGFKAGCSRAWWRLQEEGVMPGGAPLRPCGELAKPCGEPQGTVAGGEPQGTVAGRETQGTVAGRETQGTVAGGEMQGAAATVPVGSPTGGRAGERPLLFEKGYCDKILLREGQLDNWKCYLDDNPRRLAVKRLHPEYFTVMHQTEVAGLTVQMVGNRFLLDIPEKMAVIVHNAYSDEDFARYRERWLRFGENGGVLVSAVIARREKTVLREAMDRGYRIILLRENGFPPLYKPSGEAFAACSEGRLLQISPWEHHLERRVISREQCLRLNRLAETIAREA